MTTIHTSEQVAEAIANNARTGKWLSCTFTIATDKGPTGLGVKAFGKWVQRLEICHLVDGVPEQKTLKALKTETIKTIDAMVRAL